MNLRVATAIVVEALKTTTDSLGPADQAPAVESFLADPLGSPEETLIEVGSRPLGSFFHQPRPRLADVQKQVWDAIHQNAGLPAYPLTDDLLSETDVFTLAKRLANRGRSSESFDRGDIQLGPRLYVCNRCEPRKYRAPSDGPPPECELHGVMERV